MTIQERVSQDSKWGTLEKRRDEMSHEFWHVILSEEVGESAEAILEADESQLMRELVQVAAVAVAHLEWLIMEQEKDGDQF
jgi:NTP pyrophosphatase (non-canonical NTP hydrolase)